jgi:predicted DNA-binding mobile mystery protein A
MLVIDSTIGGGAGYNQHTEAVMLSDLTQLRRKQTEEMLRPYRALSGTAKPPGGWVRGIRTALGMSAAQLAARLGVIRQTVEAYERSEAAEKITLETLNRLAQAMNCRLVYALVPEKALDGIQRDRAKVVADALLQAAADSTGGETRAVLHEDARRQRKQLVKELLRGHPRK